VRPHDLANFLAPMRVISGSFRRFHLLIDLLKRERAAGATERAQ